MVECEVCGGSGKINMLEDAVLNDGSDE